MDKFQQAIINNYDAASEQLSRKGLFGKELARNDDLHIRHEQAVRALRTIAAAKRKTWEQRLATKCLREMGLK